MPSVSVKCAYCHRQYQLNGPEHAIAQHLHRSGWISISGARMVCSEEHRIEMAILINKPPGRTPQPRPPIDRANAETIL